VARRGGAGRRRGGGGPSRVGEDVALAKVEVREVGEAREGRGEAGGVEAGDVEAERVEEGEGREQVVDGLGRESAGFGGDGEVDEGRRRALDERAQPGVPEPGDRVLHLEASEVGHEPAERDVPVVERRVDLERADPLEDGRRRRR